MPLVLVLLLVAQQPDGGCVTRVKLRDRPMDKRMCSPKLILLLLLLLLLLVPLPVLDRSSIVPAFLSERIFE